MSIGLVGAAATLIGGMTLELYMTHLAISSVFLDLPLGFPLNWGLFIGATLLIAYLIHQVAKAVQARA